MDSGCAAGGYLMGCCGGRGGGLLFPTGTVGKSPRSAWIVWLGGTLEGAGATAGVNHSAGGGNFLIGHFTISIVTN